MNMSNFLYSRVCKRETHEYLGGICNFALRKVMNGQKMHFKGVSEHFQTLVSSGKFYLTELPFQRRKNEVKRSYRTQDMSPPR